MPTTLSNMREFDDTDKARELVYSGALDAVSKRFPVEDDEYRIELHKPRYTGPQDFSLDQQKQALMKERRLNTPITGNWRLIHKPTNTVLDEREDVVMHVPYYTPRGTIIHGGNEYSVVSQSRLRPGVYVRRQRTGEVEGHLNVKSGTGKPFRIQLEPQTGLFKVNVGQSSIPLYPMLKAMGITDQQLMKAWGPGLLAVNIGKQDVRSLPKLYQRFAGYRADPAADEAMQTRYLRDSLPLFEMDPEVNARTLGLTDAKGVTPEVLLRTTSKMLGVSRSEEQPDDRDSPQFSHIYSIEDLVRERIDKDAGRLTQNLLRKVRRSRNLQPIHRGALNAYLDSLLLGSGLAMPLEETNPLHTLEQLNRITKLGEGGIGSAEAITDEARDVNPGQFGFVDPITGPEGLNIGIDVRTAYRTFKGTDQNMYAEFKDARTGKLAYLRPDEAVDRVVAFPGQDFKGTTVYAMKQGRVQRVKPDDVDYVVPSFGHMMSSHTNLNPMPTAVQAGRQFYGAKFWSQYMPQVEGEVPLVDSLMPDGKSTFTEYYGRKVGTLQSKVAGTVTRVTDKGITVTDDNGKKHTYETVKDFPFNRLSVTGDTRVTLRRKTGEIFVIPIADYIQMSGDEVLSYDPDTKQSAWKTITGFTAHENTKRLFRIGFGSGRHVDVTEDHSLLTLDDSLNLVPIYPLDCVVGRTRCPIVFGTAAPNPAWSYDTGVLDGLYLSEGSISQSQAGLLRIAVEPAERQQYVRALVELQGYHPHKQQPGSVGWTSHELAARWESDFGHGAKNKAIAAHVYSRGSHYLRGLIAGYMGGDGSLHADCNGAIQVCGGSISQNLQLDLIAVLNLLGILATYTDARFNGIECDPIFKFRVRSADLSKLERWFCYPDRQSKYERLVSSRYRADTFDRIPVSKAARGIVYDALSGRISHFVYKSAGEYSIAKQRLSTCTGVVGKWANSDVLWDTVVSIDPVAHQPTVYDFSVADSEAFALADGLLVHNTGISYFPTVKAGDKVNVGDMVAHSNFTDAKTGAVNMGRNLKTAIIPFRGQSYEDAYVISESASKKLATERLYGFDADARHGMELGRGKFISAFPKTYTVDQIDKLDDNGVVKPGAVLNKGDPIILAVGPKLLTSADAQLGKLHKVLRGAFTDKSTVWEYSWPGTVTDVAMTRNGARVNVKSTPPVSEGDKLCYDPETEVLTQTGWKLFRDLTTMDCVAALNPETGHFEYLSPTAVQKYVHVGRMYQLQSQQLDLLVTDNHNLFVKTRTGTSFQLLTPDKVFGKRVSHKKDGIWVGCDQSSVHIPGVPRGHRWGPIDQPDLELPTDTFLMLLGMFLSEGNCIDNVRSSSYGIEFTQRKGISCSQMLEALEAAGFKNTYQEKSGKFRIYDKRLLTYFKQFGHAHDKFIPDWVFMLPPARLRILFRWLMWGDGHSEDGKPINYTTVSPRLADDVQRLCLHIGYAANVAIKPVSKNRIFIQEREIIARYTCYSVRIVTTKLTPTVNHGHVKQQKIQCEKWVQYTGDVYCCTLPKWHVLYVRRNGKPVWCGNSTRLGLKGVVGSIVPDDKMPRDIATNQPYELLMNPMAVLSRVAPNQIMEMALGKLARVTGKQVRLPQEPPPEGWAVWVTKQLADAGVTDSNDLFDPDSGKTLRNIGDGSVYVSAFHHLAEKKLSSRGDIGGYTSDEQPARGGNTGSKKWSQMDVNAALAHGATDVIKDVITIRGTKNEDFWKALKLGRPIPEPKVPFIYDKFLNTLRAGGINVTEKGDITSLLPMTDDDVSVLSKGAVDSSDMVDSEFEPMPGGLFDVGRTGGMAGNRWTHIDLPEPVPNPVMEEPVRRLLGLKIQQMEDILAGREKLNGLTGGPAIKAAMDKIDIDSMIAEHKQKVRTLRGANRDNSIKILGYLSSAKQQGVHPSKWMVTKIPVLPPVFRPVSRMGDVALMADLNELYRDVIETSKSFKELKGDLPEGELADERLNIYKSVKAAYGLGESITPEGQSKRLKGAIRQVIGVNPKCYDDNTEVLTDKGWVPFPDISDDTVFGTMNPESGMLEYQQASEIIHEPYIGVMVRTLTKKLDLLVTPNHQHYVATRTGKYDSHTVGDEQWNPFMKMDAGRFIGATRRVHFLSAPLSGRTGNAPSFMIGGKPADPDAMAEFLGWWLAEGWLSVNQVTICQSVNSPGNVVRIDDMCTRLGVTVDKRLYGACYWWVITDKTFHAWVEANLGSGSASKKISDEVKSWDSRYLRRLIQGYLYGDGEKLERVNTDPKINKTFYNRDSLTNYGNRASTTSRQLVDDFMVVAMHVGIGCRLTDVIVHKDKVEWHTQYRFRFDGWNRVIVEYPEQTQWEHYEGHVHCATVPNGLLVVRRNGCTAISGNSGLFQSKVISKPVDVVGRGVVTPDPNLDMDQLGIPADSAWTLYKDFVMRALVHHGYPAIRAAEMIDKRVPEAKEMLDKEMARRPVIMDRAPTWHKFNLLAFYPHIVHGHTIRVSPLVTKGFNMDFDGDQANFHVPVSDKAVEQTKSKMLPSANLFSLTDLQSVRHSPSMEMTFGLFQLTRPPNLRKPVTRFKTKKEAEEAYREGRIAANDPIEVLDM